jgi:hypothetical protein
MGLSKEEINEEMIAIDESIEAHKAQMKIHEKMLKREEFLKILVKKELEKFK